MLASLITTVVGVCLLVAAAFAHDLTTGLMAAGGVLAIVGLLVPERKAKP
jgi:hypothetical protein